eukprot:9364550-Ditylum_brightwellii.AAC.1
MSTRRGVTVDDNNKTQQSESDQTSQEALVVPSPLVTAVAVPKDDSGRKLGKSTRCRREEWA